MSLIRGFCWYNSRALFHPLVRPAHFIEISKFVLRIRISSRASLCNWAILSSVTVDTTVSVWVCFWSGSCLLPFSTSHEWYRRRYKLRQGQCGLFVCGVMSLFSPVKEWKSAQGLLPVIFFICVSLRSKFSRIISLFILVTISNFSSYAAMAKSSHHLHY